jgi:hypothetical protein
MRKLPRFLLLGVLVNCGSQRADSGNTEQPSTADGGRRDASLLDASVPPGNDAAPAQSVALNRVVMKSTHNAYERGEPLFDQLAFHQIRSVEVDIHAGKAGVAAPAGEWFVYHTDVAGQQDSSCKHLSDCLQQVMAFHRVVPKHEMISIMVDLKDALVGAQSMDALDALLQRELGAALYAPADMVKHCPGATALAPSVTGACSFPTIADLRGRILVILTGAPSCKGTGQLATYAGASGTGRPAFICPGFDANCSFRDYAATKNSVFYNMSFGQSSIASNVAAAGFIGRVYGSGTPPGLDTVEMWNRARGFGAQILATDNVNAFQDDWASTQSGRGYPFACAKVPCALDAREPGNVLGVDARSGDLEGTADSFVFLHDDVANDSVWESAIGTASSHVEPFAKGCLMARVSLAPGSPYLAVCKPADARQMRAQIRATEGGDTTIVEMTPRDTWTTESIFFMRLRVSGTVVSGEGSTDGKIWKVLAQTTLPKAPTLQGVAVSGHDSPDPVRFLFRETTRSEGAVSKVFTSAGAKALVCVGTCPKRTAFDGVVP